MSKTPTVHFEFADTIARSQLIYENGDSEQLALTTIGPGLRRLDESSFVGDALYGDIIRVKEMNDGALLFVEVAERTTLVSKSWIMSADVLKSERMETILKDVMRIGGMWELAFGGLLMVHLPPKVAETVFQQINTVWS
jgi:hypothetical protein